MREVVWDLETNGFLDKLDRVHVVSWQDNTMSEPTSGYDLECIKDLYDADMIIGHNILRFDLDAVAKVYGIRPSEKTILVDTLILAWYLDYERTEKGLNYGLEAYGITFGVPKPKIVDWDNISRELVTTRCQEDVKINMRLWLRMRNKLVALYGQKEDGSLSDDAIRLIRYLTFKMQCANDTEKQGIRLDHALATKMFTELEALKEVKTKELAEAMPKKAITKLVNKPQKPYKADGTLSEHGKRWFSTLADYGLPEGTVGPLRVVDRYEQGNPDSVPQIKDWLYGLGWEPVTFKYDKDEYGNERRIEQVRKDGELCESVLLLKEKDPAIEYLDGLTVLTHRIGIFKAYLNAAKQDADGVWWIRSTIDGLTNTFRFKHRKPLANLPGVDKPYGHEVRACLLAPSDDHVLVGADMVSLESTTKRHYMKPLDPDYVEEMSQEGFDEHLDLAKFAGACSQEDIDSYNLGTKPELKKVRKPYKAANYSAVYGIGSPKLARSISCSIKEATKLLEAYWERNWSVREIAKQQITKVLKDGSLWLQNPVSGFWHNLRAIKDTFSTLNQSTGVYVFDNWVAFIRKEGVPVIMQYHDEILTYIKRGQEESFGPINQRATDGVNNKLQLNVKVSSDWKTGDNYADVH